MCHLKMPQKDGLIGPGASSNEKIPAPVTNLQVSREMPGLTHTQPEEYIDCGPSS